MRGTDGRTTLTQRVYEYIKMRGCATTKEVAEALNVSTAKAYMAIRALYAKRLVLSYRPRVGPGRVFCIPDAGDKLYGLKSRINGMGMICITLPIDMIETLDKIATRTGKTRSNLIREALIQTLDAYLEEDDQRGQQNKSSEDEMSDFITPIR
jgi:predicted DNA-binding protein